MRADTAERMLASFYPYDDASTLITRYGLILVYNGGPGRVTINEAGWEAKDGSRVEAFVRHERTIEPGSPEFEATGDATAIVKAHDEHGGLVRMYVPPRG